MPTTAPLPAVATGTSTKTMLQLVPATQITVVEWGVSFDGSAAATPGYCELIDTYSVAATVTAYAAADVFPFSDPLSTPANTAGSSGTPLNLGTALSGYTASAEGTVTQARLGDHQRVAPTNQYLKQFPLARDFKVPTGHCLRIRMTFGATVNALCYVAFEI
jgi:hypothetical protein